MSDKLERKSKEAVVAYLKYYPETCLEGLRKPMKNLWR